MDTATTTTQPPVTTTTSFPATTTTTSVAPPTTTSLPGSTSTSNPTTTSSSPAGATNPEVDAITAAAPVISPSSGGSAMAATGTGSLALRLGALALASGLTLIVEAAQSKLDPVARAVGVRNGLMIAFLALLQLRLKNFAGLEIGHTFKLIDITWWVTIPKGNTKTQIRPIEKPLPRL